MGFLDYYKQFQELSPQEVSADFRAVADERRAKQLAVIRILDLTATTWWEPPHPEVVNAATFALRRAMNLYPDPAATEVREMIGHCRGGPAVQVVVGHGAGELLHEALSWVLHSGGEVVVPWPSWQVLPAMVARSGGEPVQVALAPDQSLDVDATLAAVTPRTKAVVVCSPNDPTGLPVATDELERLARGLGEGVWLLVDEALAEFRTDEDDATRLTQLGNVICFRSFSKAHAMAGFRVGYAVGPEGAEDFLAHLQPVQGVNAPAQAGIAWALDDGLKLVARRRRAAAREREKLANALRGTSFSFPPSEAPFVWLSSSEHPAHRVHAHLSQRHIQVMPGATWSVDADAVRIQIRDTATMAKLSEALAAPFASD